jgi:cytochrome P450
MMLHPGAQTRAQQEIDAVIGTDRLPTFSDRSNLPYCNALWWEVLRWNPIAPLGLPHAAAQDDTITVKTVAGDETYLIPKGAVILPNIYRFCRDPAVYKNPEQFDPTRFLGDKPEPDPTDFVFGFGRRVCPGKILADSSAWLMMTQILATFDVQKKAGVSVPEVGVQGIVQHAKPEFKKAMDVKIREVRRPLLERLNQQEAWEDGSDGEKLKSVVVDFSGLE